MPVRMMPQARDIWVHIRNVVIVLIVWGVLVDVCFVVLEARLVALDVVDEGVNVTVSIEHLGD